jgi:hypothetical protein
LQSGPNAANGENVLENYLLLLLLLLLPHLAVTIASHSFKQKKTLPPCQQDKITSGRLSKHYHLSRKQAKY